MYIDNAPKPVTISFSEKNRDVAKLLEDFKKELGRSFNQNDYVCQCIRFFQENKDKSFGDLNEDHINEMIDKKLEEFKKQLINKELVLDLEEEIKSEALELNNKILEEKVNFDESAYEED
jgi:hypothetical protein